MGENCPVILPKSATWDRWLYFPSEGRCTEDFFALKNPAASARFEPANLGTKGQHATPRPPKPLRTHPTTQLGLCPRPHKKKEVKKNEQEQGVTRPASQPPTALHRLPNYPHNLINYSTVITLGLQCFSCCFHLFCMNLINDSHKSKLY